jgi:HAD superfamily hydrolase (TIGR01509 family)
VKPEKKIFRHLIETMNLNPAESLFIDDLKPNILAAVSLGFNTIHYSSHNKFLKEFRAITGLE